MKSSSTRGAIREDALDPDANERREAYRRIGRRLIPFLMFLWIMRGWTASTSASQSCR